MALTKHETIAISTTGLVTSTLSVIGSLIVIFLFLKFPRLRTFKGKLVVYLSISDLLWTVSIMMGMSWYVHDSQLDSIPNWLCNFTGFMLQWFIVAEIFWVGAIAIYMYFLVVKKIDFSSKERIFHLICWTIPFIVSLLPFMGVGRGYGPAGTWCWVVSPEARLFFSYFFVWVTFVIIGVSYTLMIRHIRSTFADVEQYQNTKEIQQRKSKDARIFRKMAAYPIIFLIQWIPATINRVQNAADPENPIAALFAIHVGLVTFTGFLNLLNYGAFNLSSIKKLLGINEATSTVSSN